MFRAPHLTINRQQPCEQIALEENVDEHGSLSESRNSDTPLLLSGECCITARGTFVAARPIQAWFGHSVSVTRIACECCLCLLDRLVAIAAEVAQCFFATCVDTRGPKVSQFVVRQAYISFP